MDKDLKEKFNFIEHNIKWTDEKVSRLWDYYAKTPPYSSMYFTSVYAMDIINISKKYIQLNEKVVLDYGSGAGYLLKEFNLEYHVKTYYALDFSQNSVDIAKNMQISFPVNPILVESFPSEIRDESVDICFLIEVIEHLNNHYLDETLKEIYRVLKKDGILILTTPNNEKLENNTLFCPDCGCKFHKWQHQRSWDKETLRFELLAKGFQPLKVFATNLKTKNSFKNIFRTLKSLYTKEEKKNLIGIFKK